MNASKLVHTIGSSTGSFAKRIGRGTADLASKVGGGTASLARSVGPKRGLIGLAVIGGMVAGGIFLARFLKRRALVMESMTAPDGMSTPAKNGEKHVAQDAVTY